MKCYIEINTTKRSETTALRILIAWLTILLFILVTHYSRAQAPSNNTDGVSIAPTQSPPHDAAMLHVKSKDKGVLIPRMSHTEMQNIQNTTGGDALQVFVNGTSDFERGLWFFDENGSGNWVRYGIDIKKLMPENAVVPFNLSQCPTGWKPFIQGEGKFIVGSDGSADYTTGMTGGQDKVALKKNEIPKHQHNFNGTASGMQTATTGHTHEIYSRSKGTKVGKHRTTGYGRGKNRNKTEEGGSSPVVSHSHSHKVSGTLTGLSDGGVGLGGAAHENRPPYVVVTYCVPDFYD